MCQGVRPLLILFYFNLLNLRSQFLQGAVAINSVGDVIPKAVAQHALAVSFPDAIALTQPAEGMPAGMRRPNHFGYEKAPALS